MRVRMLKAHEVTITHPEHGQLTLVYAAGSTQHFDDATAQTLIDATEKGKPAPIAAEHPEESTRVRMLRSETVNGDRYAKGDLVHFPNEVASALLDAKNEEGQPSPAAKLEPDEEADHVASTLQEATDAAIARKLEQEEATKRRDEIKARAAAAAAAAGSGSPARSTPVSPVSRTAAASTAAVSDAE